MKKRGDLSPTVSWCVRVCVESLLGLSSDYWETSVDGVCLSAVYPKRTIMSPCDGTRFATDGNQSAYCKTGVQGSNRCYLTDLVHVFGERCARRQGSCSFFSKKFRTSYFLCRVF